jgi:hypothetical protein
MGDRKIWFWTVIVALVLIAAAGYMAIHRGSPSAASNYDPHGRPAAPTNMITVTGSIECLKPKSTAGQQVTSCAIGIKGDNGQSYALSSSDPATTGSLPTGQRVEVRGSLQQQITPYAAEGVIKVSSIQRR